MKLKASPAGGARIMRIVSAHLTKYGPSGVPKGRVEAQKRGKGSTPCLLSRKLICQHTHQSNWATPDSSLVLKTHLPHSLISLDEPINTAIKFPNELNAIKKFNPLTAPLDPNTLVKNRLAAIC